MPRQKKFGGELRRLNFEVPKALADEVEKKLTGDQILGEIRELYT